MLSRTQAILFFICIAGLLVTAALGVGRVVSEHSFDVRNQAWDEALEVITDGDNNTQKKESRENIARIADNADSTVTSQAAVVSRIIDGDTFVLENDERVRLIGIDTPEVTGTAADTCYASAATELATELLLEKSVQLVYDKDKYDRYGRTLAYVYVDEMFVNEALVTSGAAVAKAYPPNTAQQAVLEQAEARAQEEKKGLWGECQ